MNNEIGCFNQLVLREYNNKVNKNAPEINPKLPTFEVITLTTKLSVWLSFAIAA